MSHMHATGRLRILHVLGALGVGGVETWLVDVLRHIDRERFGMDFLVHTAQPGTHDDDVRELGSTIIPCLHPRRPPLYARTFKRVLREQGPYDVVHSHVHHFSGYVLRLAQQAGIRIRIAHCHSDRVQREAHAGMVRRGYLRMMEQWIARYATVGLAASRQAARDLCGPAWEADPRWRVLLYGRDLRPYQVAVDPGAVRAELGLPPEAFVIGHVGRFVEAKNHAFLVDIARAVATRAPHTRVLLVGDGPLRPAIAQQVAHAGLADRVVFAGARSDVPRLLQGAMDVFVFPSLFEGLGLALLEAQAAGVRCVASAVVPEEVDVIKPLVRRVSLAQPAAAWAEVILATRAAAPGITRQNALALVEQSAFNMRTHLEQLERIYHG
jgi:glycosyltransferase involved in cell wall biosynthesis